MNDRHCLALPLQRSQTSHLRLFSFVFQTYIIMGDKRTTLPRRKAYHTKSNRMQVVKTPGGKLVMHVVKKRSAGPKCGDTGVQLHGVRSL